MSGVNKVLLIGNLGKDPEIRNTPGGTAVANFSIATSEKFKDKNGERQERTEWHRLVAFNRTAEVVGEYLHKGSKVFIEGRLQTRKWTDKEGVERYSTEIIVDNLQMLDGKPAGDRPAAPARQQPARGRRTDDEFDDDIPL